MPDRYDTVGPNYVQWGEQPGFTYDPATDKYVPNAAKQPSGAQSAANGLLSLGKGAAISAAAKALAGEAVPASVAGFTIPGAGIGGGGAAAGGGGALSVGGIGSAGNAILPVAGAAGLANLLSVDHMNKNAKGWARGIGQGAASGAALGSFFGLPGAGIGAGLGGLLGLGKVAFGHKSTKDYQNQRRDELLGRDITGYADFINQLPKSVEDDPNYGKVPVMADLKAEDVWGSNGVFDTFGSDWLGKFSEDERRRISKRLLDEDLFKSDHGDIIIHSDNKERAMQIAEEERKQKEKEKEEPKDNPARGEGPAPIEDPIV